MDKISRVMISFLWT